METQPCADCGKPVSTADIQQNKGGEVGGIYFCADCFAKLQAQEAEEGEPQSPPAPQPAPAPAPQTQRRRRRPPADKDGSGGVKPVTRRTARLKKKDLPPKKKPASERAAAAEEPALEPVSDDSDIAEKGKKGSPLVLILFIIIGLLAALLVFLLVTSDKETVSSASEQVLNTTEPENPAPEPEHVSQQENEPQKPETEPVAEPENISPEKNGPDEPGAEPAAEPEQGEGEPGQNDKPAPPALAEEKKALAEINDALMYRDYKNAYRLARKAKKSFPDDEALSQVFETSEKKITAVCTDLFEKAQTQETVNENKAKELYSEIMGMNVAGFSDEAEKAFTAIDERKNAEKMKVENKAREHFLNASVYFNDYMENKDRTGVKPPPEAEEFLNLLLKDFSQTDFVKAKRDIIEMQLRLLKGGSLPD